MHIGRIDRIFSYRRYSEYSNTPLDSLLASTRRTPSSNKTWDEYSSGKWWRKELPEELTKSEKLGPENFNFICDQVLSYHPDCNKFRRKKRQYQLLSLFLSVKFSPKGELTSKKKKTNFKVAPKILWTSLASNRIFQHMDVKLVECMLGSLAKTSSTAASRANFTFNRRRNRFARSKTPFVWPQMEWNFIRKRFDGIQLSLPFLTPVTAKRRTHGNADAEKLKIPRRDFNLHGPNGAAVN